MRECCRCKSVHSLRNRWGGWYCDPCYDRAMDFIEDMRPEPENDEETCSE